nr:hypothetical protein GCM10020092_038690 [Actinoplanes digitatis]
MCHAADELAQALESFGLCRPVAEQAFAGLHRSLSGEVPVGGADLEETAVAVAQARDADGHGHGAAVLAFALGLEVADPPVADQLHQRYLFVHRAADNRDTVPDRLLCRVSVDPVPRPDSIRLSCRPGSR